MLFQDAPAAFDRIVLAVIRRKVQQLNGFVDLVSELHHAVEKLGAYPAAFRSVIDLELDLGGSRLFERIQTLPPNGERIDDEIAGLVGATEVEVEVGGVFVDNPTGDIFLFTAHVMIAGLVIAAGAPTAGEFAQAHRRFTIHAQTPHGAGLDALAIFFIRVFWHNAQKGAFWRSCDQFFSDHTLDHFLNHFLHIDDILGFGEFVTAVEIDVLPGDQGNLLECCYAIEVTDALLVFEQV